MTRPAPATVSRVLTAALATRVTPGAVLEVGTSRGEAYTIALGAHSYARDAEAVSRDTIYDLASLTKVLATTPLALRAAADDTLPLDTRVASRVALPADYDTVTVQDLLEHAGGFTAHRPFHRRVAGRRGLLHALVQEPAAYPPRTTHVYTDLGFILLAMLVEEATATALRPAFAAMRDAMTPHAALWFDVPQAARDRIAPSGLDDWRGRVLRRHVHDGNAAALGGAAGHAGLFGTASGVGGAARWWLARLAGGRVPAVGLPHALVQRAVSRGVVPGSSRGLGWDTMLRTSSCGTRLSAAAFGHTGFTGTSLWIDPARDLYVVLLTNRVHASDDTAGIRALRIAVHDAVADAWDADVLPTHG